MVTADEWHTSLLDFKLKSPNRFVKFLERRKRWSDTYKGVPDSDEDEADNAKEVVDEKLKKEEEELNKIASGIGKVFLKDVKKREELKQWKAAHLDPRNASR